MKTATKQTTTAQLRLAMKKEKEMNRMGTIAEFARGSKSHLQQARERRALIGEEGAEAVRTGEVALPVGAIQCVLAFPVTDESFAYLEWKGGLEGGRWEKHFARSGGISPLLRMVIA